MRIVVSSDDDLILTWARLHGLEVHQRPDNLADDHATISDVATHLADELDWEGDVGVFQPTSPLTKASTLTSAIEEFRSGNWDSLASCVREAHLYWHDSTDKSKSSSPQPLFEARVNRQELSSRVLRETGAIQLVKGEILRKSKSMVTERHFLFEVDSSEALDIDTFDDLEIARRKLERSHIIFRLSANRKVGSGHLFHCLQLAEELNEHRATFLLKNCDDFVRELLSDRQYMWVDEIDLSTQLAELQDAGARLIVNDVLDTTQEDVLAQRAHGFKVVNIEDLGPGRKYADWVVNALYRTDGSGENVSSGAQWAVLRDEFLDPPPSKVRKDANTVLVTFGGTDPNDLGARCGRLFGANRQLDVTVVQGPGAREIDVTENIQVKKSVRSMALEMHEADIVITSAGRTVYEAAAMGTPTVVLAQNAREATHSHLDYKTGVIFLGIAPLVDDSQIRTTVERLLSDYTLRLELSERLKKSVDLRGRDRIAARLRLMIQGC